MDEALSPPTPDAGLTAPILATSRTALPSFIRHRLDAWLGRIGYVPRSVTSGLDHGMLWNDRAQSGRDISMALVAWLEGSGWVLAKDDPSPETPHRLDVQPSPAPAPLATRTKGVLKQADPDPEQYVHAFSHAGGSARLLAVAVPPSQSLTFSLLGGRRPGDAPRSHFRQVILARHFSSGVLCNGRDLLWALYDTNGEWQEVLATCRQPHAEFSDLPFADWHLFDALCAPIVVEQRESFLHELAAHQATELAKLERRLTVAAPQFVDHLLTLPGNADWAATIGQSERLVTSLWHETMLLTFSLILVIRTLPRARTERLVTNYDCGTEVHVRIHPVLTQLSRSLAPTAGSSTPQAVREFMDYIAESMNDPDVDVEPECPRPESLILLRRSNIDLPACRTLLDAITGSEHACDDHGSPEPGACAPLEGMGEFELIHLFETLLELRPHIAHTTMVRLRRGRHEVVVEDEPGCTFPVREAGVLEGGSGDPDGRSPHRDPSRHPSGKAEIPVPGSSRLTEPSRAVRRRARSGVGAARGATTIAAGKFYVVHTDARKAAGAFYTPRPLARVLTRACAEAYLSHCTRMSARALLRVGVLDPAMGVGAFLLEAADVFGTLVFDALEDEGSRIRQGLDIYGELVGATSAKPPQVMEPSQAELHGTPQAGLLKAKPTLTILRALEARRYQQWRRCKTAFAARGLYGVDLNPVAVAIAKFALFSQCEFDGKVASKLRKHLVAGNSLTGPRIHQLEETPFSRVALSDAHCADVRELTSQLKSVHIVSAASRSPQHERGNLQVTPSGDAAKGLQALARIWSGAVLHGQAGDDDTYIGAIAEQAAPRVGESNELATAAHHLEQLGREAVCFELAFPERFTVRGNLVHAGFDIVLGNPPWDCVKHDSRTHLAEFDLRARTVPTRRERDALAREVLATETRAVEWSTRVESFEGLKRAHDRLYHHQKVIVNGELAGRQLDLFRIFIERSWDLLSQKGVLAQVIPSAFHTAAGATGIRRLLMTTGSLLTYAAFRNTKKWFDVSRELEFGLLVASRHSLEHHEIRFLFGLEDPIALVQQTVSWLRLLQKSVLANNPYATLPAVRGQQELDTLLSAQGSGRTLATFMSESNVDLRSTPTTVHRTHEAIHFVDLPSTADFRRTSTDTRLLADYGAVLHEGATFERYDDTWGTPPKYAVKLSRVQAVPRYGAAVKHYRLVMRAIVGSSKHKCIASMVTPGTLVANSALVESQPWLRPTYQALVAMAVLNSSAASVFLSAFADLNVNLFALRRLPWPKTLPEAFLAHSAVQLVANHAGWAPLWREQLSEGRCDHDASVQFPCVADLPRRQLMRARIDAVVAKAYEMTREQYLSIVGQFPGDPVFGQGPAAFDELEDLGMTDFCRRHDDYHQVALVQSLP